MRRVFVLFIALLVATATTGVAQAGNKKPFYDVKSQLLGVSGDIDTLKARGFASKMFANDVAIDHSILPKIDESSKKTGWTDEQIASIIGEMNRQRIGHQVLEVLFPYVRDENGNAIKLSEKEMNKRAMANAQYIDVEKAQIGALDVNSILRDDWTPLLENNYIYLESHWFKDFANFIIFQVDITDDVIKQVYDNWNNPVGFEAINPEVRFVYQGAEKYKNPQKFQRKLSENVPAFAIRGQLTGRNPATARMGKKDGLSKGDMVTIYRQALTEDGEMVSNRISRARVNYVDRENCQMTFIAGTRGSYKAGDMVVLTPDKKQGIGIYGNYSLGRFFGASITWDRITNVTKAGFSGRMLIQTKVDYADYDTQIYKPEYNPPIILDFGMGYGLAWTALGRFEFMPFFMIGYEMIILTGNKAGQNKEGNGIFADAFRGACGLKFDLNIAYPVKLSFGAEYGYVTDFGLSDKLDKTNGVAGWNDSYKVFEEAFKNNGTKHSLKRNGFNFFAGLRFVF